MNKYYSVSSVHIDHAAHTPSNRPNTVPVSPAVWIDTRPVPYRFHKRPSPKSIKNMMQPSDYNFESPLWNSSPKRERQWLHSGKRKIKANYKSQPHRTILFMPEKQASTFNDPNMPVSPNSRKHYRKSFDTRVVRAMLKPQRCTQYHKDHPAAKPRRALDDIYQASIPRNTETKMFHSQSNQTLSISRQHSHSRIITNSQSTKNLTIDPKSYSNSSKQLRPSTSWTAPYSPVRSDRKYINNTVPMRSRSQHSLIESLLH